MAGGEDGVLVTAQELAGDKRASQQKDGNDNEQFTIEHAEGG